MAVQSLAVKVVVEGVPRMVEAAGVEPASEKVRREKTTCVSDSVIVVRRIRTGKKTTA